MTNPYFTKSGTPSSHAPGASSPIRAEIVAIEAGFDKLPTLSGNALKLIRINAGANGLEPIGTIDDIPIGATTPSTGAFTTLSASGGITGNLTGTVTGNVTGNASTATTLQTPRNINGVPFSGSADITVTAAAGTLTGATLAPGVTASSLTSLGVLGSLSVTGGVTAATFSGSGASLTTLNASNLSSGSVALARLTLLTDILADTTSASNAVNLLAYIPSAVYTFGLGLFLNNVYARTAVEAAAGVTPTNYWYPPGNALRYGTNTIPGTTNMTTAIQNAILCCGTGAYRGKAYIPAGAYLVTESLTPGPAGSVLAKALVIFGDEQATQLINGCSANKPTFDCSGRSQWTIRDMLLTGNSSHPNNGILVDGTTNNTIRWRIERVVTMMAGTGIKLKNTNSGVIHDCKSWPDNNDNAVTIPPVVTATDIDHHVYMTGGFCHDISIYDPDMLSSTGYKAGACGIRCDATGPNFGIRIFGGLLQSEDLSTSTANPSVFLSNCDGYTLEGPYFEGAAMKFGSCSNGVIKGNGNGGLGGKLQFFSSSEYNTIIGVHAQFLDMNDSSVIHNTIIGGLYTDATTPINDAAEPFNRYINVKTSVASRYSGYDKGGDPWVTVTYSASMTPNTALGRKFNIVPNNATAFIVNEPSLPIDGIEVVVKIRNPTGGALGALTWGAQIKAASTTQPANGFTITRTFAHDKSYGSGILWIQIGADVTTAN